MKKNLLVLMALTTFVLSGCGSRTAEIDYDDVTGYDSRTAYSEVDYETSYGVEHDMVNMDVDDSGTEDYNDSYDYDNANSYDCSYVTGYSEDEYQVASSSWVCKEAPLTFEQLVGKWVDDSDPDTPRIIEFYVEDGQYKYSYYTYRDGNSYGINIANDFTCWEYCSGLFALTEEYGWIDCYVSETDNNYISLEYEGLDGTLVSCDGDGHVFVKNDSYNYR